MLGVFAVKKEIRVKAINTMSKTAAEKPAFRDAMRRRAAASCRRTDFMSGRSSARKKSGRTASG
jgi:hypothetical protein